MAMSPRLSRLLWRQTSGAHCRIQHLAYSSKTSKNYHQKVQTPIQSQNKDDIVHPQFQPAEGTSVQTPIQSQDPAEVTPSPTKSTRGRRGDPWPYYTLFGGLLAGSVFVYFYYLHRKEHMQRKWENMLKEAREKAKGNG